MKNELRQLHQDVRTSLKTAANNKFLAEIAQADKLNVLDRIKRDLNKFKEASAYAGDGARLSSAEKNEIIKKLKKHKRKQIKLRLILLVHLLR